MGNIDRSKVNKRLERLDWQSWYYGVITSLFVIIFGIMLIILFRESYLYEWFVNKYSGNGV